MAYDTRPAKRIFFAEEATDKIAAGIRKMAEAVGLTMGPRGWNVLMRLGGVGGDKPFSTKDGVTVANHVMLEDPEEDLGAQVALQAARNTNDRAGDGTTATIVLLDAMFEEARKRVRLGSNPIEIQRGMQEAMKTTVSLLKAMSMEVKDEKTVYNVAHISSQDEEIARQITDAVLAVGEYGAVNVEGVKGPGYSITWAQKKGMHFDSGFADGGNILSMPHHDKEAQDKQGAQLTWQYDDVGVLIFDEPVRTFSDIAPLLDAVIEAGQKKLLLFGDFRDDAAAGLRKNIAASKAILCAIPKPYPGELGRETLKDIAAYTGAYFFTAAEGQGIPERIEEGEADKYLGRCSAAVTRDATTLSAGGGDEETIQKRMGLIEELMEQEKKDYYKQKYRERIARFKASVATITITAGTDLELQSVRTRVDDAVSAIRSANEEGYVPGSGVALVRVHNQLDEKALTGRKDDFLEGFRIVKEALLKPCWQIAHVAGERADAILEQTMRMGGSTGYDYWQAGFVDLIGAGVIDPTKVVRLSVENSVSAVGDLLRTRCTITDAIQEEGVMDNPLMRRLLLGMQRAAPKQ